MSVDLVYYYEGHTELGIPHVHWDYLARNLNLGKLYVVCQQEHKSHLILTSKRFFSDKCDENNIYESLIQIRENNPSQQYVYSMPFGVIEEHGYDYQWLHEFKHPLENVTYVLGSDESGIPQSEISSHGTTILAIEGVLGKELGQDIRYQEYFAFTAANLIFCDRIVKEKLGL